MKIALGQKLGMTRVFDTEGRALAVTMVKLLPAKVTQIKSDDKDGYSAIQITSYKNEEKANVLRSTEFRVEDLSGAKAGSILKIDFENGDFVSIQGKSKGKGFAGTIKRHGFKRGPETHGGNNVREPGSIGAQQPQRVTKGRHMAGHMGYDTITVKNLKVVDINNDIMLVSGAVPGPRKSVLKIYGKAVKAEPAVEETNE